MYLPLLLPPTGTFRQPRRIALLRLEPQPQLLLPRPDAIPEIALGHLIFGEVDIARRGDAFFEEEEVRDEGDVVATGSAVVHVLEGPDQVSSAVVQVGRAR